jgi:phage repressor protein C with HTH and peptisase S24 domain
VVTAEQLVSAGPGAAVLGESSGGARYVALRVAGDSMVPDVLEGDTVVIDLEQSQPDPGVIVVAVVSDQVYVKRLRRPGGGRPRLQSADGSLLSDSPEQTFRVVQIRRDL